MAWVEECRICRPPPTSSRGDIAQEAESVIWSLLAIARNQGPENKGIPYNGVQVFDLTRKNTEGTLCPGNSAVTLLSKRMRPEGRRIKALKLHRAAARLPRWRLKQLTAHLSAGQLASMRPGPRWLDPRAPLRVPWAGPLPPHRTWCVALLISGRHSGCNGSIAHWVLFQ